MKLYESYLLIENKNLPDFIWLKNKCVGVPNTTGGLDLVGHYKVNKTGEIRTGFCRVDKDEFLKTKFKPLGNQTTDSLKKIIYENDKQGRHNPNS